MSRKRAEELSASGMPFQMAMAVANGRLELSEALVRMARADKVAELMSRYELSRALATQVALGHADLERVLLRQRFEAHRAQHRERSVLEIAEASGDRMAFELHGKRRLMGVVQDVTAYTFAVRGDDGVDEVHKLQAQAAWRTEDWKTVRKSLRSDKRRSASPKEPVPKPQDRYPCSDKRLFRCLDAETSVVATLLEGMQIAGKITWFSRFEFGLQAKTGGEAVVFRHALDHLREG